MKRKIIAIILTAVFVISLSGSAYAGRTLSNGTSGDDVYALQQILAAYGYFYEEPTGYFGNVTQNALASLQADLGLAADGIAGPTTAMYLGLVTNDESYGSYDAYGYYDSTASASLYRSLSYGMSGDDVTYLQQLLAAYGFFYGVPSGYFGELTEAAVINFQYAYGIDPIGIAGPQTIAALTGDYSGTDTAYSTAYSYEDYAAAVLDAVDWTPSAGAGYCASWVTQVMKNAGILTYDITSLRPTALSYAGDYGFNANDYWAYVCYSENINDLQPGMIIATRNSNSYLGQTYGHVGIYIGDGLVVSSVGYKETLTVDEWIRRYNNTAMGSTARWGYLPY